MTSQELKNKIDEMKKNVIVSGVAEQEFNIGGWCLVGKKEHIKPGNFVTVTARNGKSSYIYVAMCGEIIDDFDDDNVVCVASKTPWKKLEEQERERLRRENCLSQVNQVEEYCYELERKLETNDFMKKWSKIKSKKRIENIRTCIKNLQHLGFEWSFNKQQGLINFEYFNEREQLQQVSYKPGSGKWQIKRSNGITSTWYNSASWTWLLEKLFGLSPSEVLATQTNGQAIYAKIEHGIDLIVK